MDLGVKEYADRPPAEKQRFPAAGARLAGIFDG